MNSNSLSQKRFTLEDQKRFSSISGDVNPIHVDPLVSRRLLHGRPIVHGIHCLLWCLQSVFSHLKISNSSPFYVVSINVHFLKPIFLDEDVGVYESEAGEESHTYYVKSDNKYLSKLTLEFGQGRKRDLISDGIGLRPRVPIIRTIEKIIGTEGEFPPFFDTDKLNEIYPLLSEVMGTANVTDLIAISFLVGMECPGMHSLLSSINLNFEANSARETIKYKVSDADTRFNRLDIEFVGLGSTGNIVAYVPKPPVIQKSISEISQYVSANEFEGQNAFIIGGSRGLGELTAKIIAAGSGNTTLSYVRGYDDCRDIQNKIISFGAECSIIKLDIRDGRERLFRELSSISSPTHIYYFATPNIKLDIADRDFDHRVFEDYLAFYVTGFANLCAVIDELRWFDTKIFYPSSQAVEIENANLEEYQTAKKCGELICKAMGDETIFVDRLPRLNTDQTNSIVPVSSEDNLQVMLPIIRKMNQ